jgi:hypothetical protein
MHACVQAARKSRAEKRTRERAGGGGQRGMQRRTPHPAPALIAPGLSSRTGPTSTYPSHPSRRHSRSQRSRRYTCGLAACTASAASLGTGSIVRYLHIPGGQCAKIDNYRKVPPPIHTHTHTVRCCPPSSSPVRCSPPSSIPGRCWSPSSAPGRCWPPSSDHSSFCPWWGTRTRSATRTSRCCR